MIWRELHFQMKLVLSNNATKQRRIRTRVVRKHHYFSEKKSQNYLKHKKMVFMVIGSKKEHIMAKLFFHLYKNYSCNLNKMAFRINQFLWTMSGLTIRTKSRVNFRVSHHFIYIPHIFLFSNLLRINLKGREIIRQMVLNNE
ncbi:hypothetical protein M153_1970008878 [Pseudoloma neurophilia]|uniref:Uncharacterized protein n=1 Tax=Pseudoloma neurophilia TaxID=146866 RepID=A0A0R0LZ57_9MICR|nr:hypothetical protein M153_1970008878 [Pseudoloma neurophilia]